MGFFDPPPKINTGIPASRHADHGEIPAVAGLNIVMAQTDDVAVVLGQLEVWHGGLQLTLWAVAHDATVNLLSALAREVYAEAGRSWPPPELLRFGVQYADGRKATNLDEDRLDPSEPSPPIAELHLQQYLRSGGTGGHCMGFRLTPLPPEGTMLFVCEWPEYAIAESRVMVEGKLVLDAAARARRLWPDDRRRPQI